MAGVKKKKLYIVFLRKNIPLRHRPLKGLQQRGNDCFGILTGQLAGKLLLASLVNPIHTIQPVKTQAQGALHPYAVRARQSKVLAPRVKAAGATFRNEGPLPALTKYFSADSAFQQCEVPATSLQLTTVKLPATSLVAVEVTSMAETSPFDSVMGAIKSSATDAPPGIAGLLCVICESK